MSKEAFEQMMQTASTDATLQQKLENAAGFSDVVKIGSELGYNFTEDEAQTALNQRGINLGNNSESEDGELSEEMLEAVAGGDWGSWTDNWRIRIGW